MIYFIPTPIGNLKDISLHALDVLRDCEVALCEDTRVSKSLISLLNQKFSLDIKLSEFIPFHTHNQKDFLENVNISFFDKNIAFISDAGMPCISDPGEGLVKYAIKNNIKYEVLTGANAALLAIVASGLVQKEFIFLGFLPNNGKERLQAIENALNLTYPCVIYESPKRILNLINQIAILDQNRKIFLIKEATKKFETKFSGNAKELVEILSYANLSGEWSLVLDKSPNLKQENISFEDINSLDIAPKIKAKLLSKLTGQNSKEIYKKLTEKA